MTNSEIKQIEEILNYFVEKEQLMSYKMKDNVIVADTTEKEKKDIDFLIFRIRSAIGIINEDFDKSIKVEVSNS